MKQVMRFDVNGETDEVTRDELDEYQRVTKEHGDAPDEIQTFRMTGADGRSEDVDVPASEMEDFRAAAEQNGEKYQRVMTMQMDDGSRQDMTGNEVSRYLRSDAYRKSPGYKPPEQGSPALAGAVGGVGGFFAGLWHGGNAAANAIAKAIPEIGIEVESALGHISKGIGRIRGEGENELSTLITGEQKKGFFTNVGDYLVKNAAGAKAWLDEKLPSEAKEWTGYEDWSTKVSDKIGQVAAMAYKFAPAMATKPAEIAAMGTQAAHAAGAKVVPDAASKFGPFMETVFGSDGVNAYADMFAKAKYNGASDIEAAEAGGTAFLINYFGGKLMMRAGGVAEGIESPIAKFMVGGAAVSDVTGVQAAANKYVENVATGKVKGDTFVDKLKSAANGTWEAFQEGAVEGWMFHGMNAVPGAVLQGFENRAARIRYNEMARREILEKVKTSDGAAQLAVLMDTEAIDRAISARKEELARTEAGGTTSGREDVKSLAIAAGLPETMTKAEMIRVLDAVSQQRQAQAERVRTRMDDVQAEALAETIQKSVEADVSAGNLAADKEAQDVFEKTWLKAVEKVGDASVLDDPELRDKIVGEAYKAVRGDVAAAKEAERAEKSRIRGSSVADQMGEIEKRGIESWEDAEADGLIGKDERGRWSGGMRTALNIAINGTDKLKTAVKDGVVSGPVAEDLVTVSYCELGERTPEERAALVDRILDLADGNEAMARRMMDKIGQRDAADETPLLDDLKRVADEVTVEMEREIAEGLDPTSGGAPERQPATAFEGAVNAERMKGTELHSREGAVMGCERFPEVRVEISQEGIVVEGLTDELMSRPENAADAAALLKRLGDIAERNGLTVDLGDANAKTVADGIMDEINRGGLETTQRKMDTRAQLFNVLAKTTLGNGVTFDEASFKAALEKTENGRQFVDSHGGVYGFVDTDGVIHFNPTAINYNTPIHEYGHLALEAVKKVNGGFWQRGMDLVKESSYYRDLLAEVERDENSPYARFSDEQLRDEALARLIGDRGERLVETHGLEAKLKEWLKEFWKTFKGALGVADLTEEQIEKMSLGDFVGAINAELLRGKEFGSKKAVSIEKRSIKRFDEDQNSGSNGLLRWKNDRGYLFAIPVDMERTQPGGRVVLATDDANVTDWIQNALNGVELRMSRTGKLYVKGRDGLDGELAEVFGRYPTIGQNDGIFEQIASETGNRAMSGAARDMTPEALVEALRADRESYDAWKQGRDVEAERLADEQAHDEWLAQQRWENSGMSVADYVRNRVEEGDPEFDLDWETAREIERDRAAGRFAVSRQENDAWTKTIDEFTAGNLAARTDVQVLPRVPAVISRVLNDVFGLLPTGKDIIISSDAIKKAMIGKHRISADEMKKLAVSLDAPLAVFQSKTRPMDSITALIPIRDANGGISSIVPIDYTAKLSDGKPTLRITSVYGKTSAEAVQEWIDKGYLLYADRKNISRSFPHRLQLPGRTKTANRFLDENDFSEEALGIVSNPVDAGNGLAKMSYSQPSLFDQIYQQTFDFNRQTEQPRQQELNLSVENAKQISENAKPLIRTDKIEDVGEKISGARKDILKNYVAAIDDATREQLYALPFSKAFKRPDLVKAVQTGTMREQDANFYETILSTIVQKKPLVTARDARMKKYRPDYETNLDKWVDNTQNALSILKQFLGLDEAGRDQFMRTVLENKHINVAADQQRIEEVRSYNPGREIKTGECYTPNPIYVASEVLKRIGHKTGDKVDIPFALKPSTLFDSYRIVDAKGDSYYKLEAKELESAIDNIAYLTKLKRGDTDLEHPDAAFTISSDRMILAENGQYRVYWGKGTGVENQRDFASKEQAEEFAKTKPASLHPMSYPVKAVVGRTDYSVKFVNNITGEVSKLGDKIFETREEAQRYLDENREDVNDLANSELAKKAGKPKPKSEMTADKLVQVGYSSRSENHWVVVEQDKDEQTVIRSFKTREEANKYRDEIKADYFEQWKKNKEDRKKFVYFDTGDQKRIGEDYRQDKDVKAEDFMNEFGFRGVQFGNWTNQADRQMAVNQAYDAFMDLSKLIGIPPKALSLNGELGIAFGARGSGSALAHYEPSEVVINLTKTKGAGSLAHEWWHALDNYFARAAGSKGGMVTDSDWLNMRSELREAFNAFTRNMRGSNYGIRSARQGAYWGRMHEITARFLAEWVDQSLKKQGRLNTFLSRGVNEDGWLEMNYDLYRQQMQAAKTEPVSIEEFEKNPNAYKGFPFPTKKEVAEFGENVRRIFDTIKVREEGEGANTTYALFAVGGHGSGNASPNGRPIVNKSLFVAGRARVADPGEWGEQTPGALAASSELSNQGVTPMSSYGAIRKMSLPLPLLEFLRKRMADSPLPAHVAERMPGGKYASHSRSGQLYISADVFGTVDKTDMAKEKAFLKQHGFFRNEDNNWCAGQLQNDIAREKRRSEDQLATQLLNLGSRRVRGQEPGGQEAARKVFADEVAKYILRMPQSAPGVLGKMQTIGKALRAEIVRQYGGAAKDAQDKAKQEAGGFLDWAYGGPLVDPATGNPVSRGDALGLNDLSDSMFGAWLVMPQEMERRAPNWSASFESTIAAEPKLADAFREMTMLGSTEQATGYIMDKLKAQQKRSTEEALKQLWWESREPISTGSKVADAKETLLVGFHDKFAPVYVRVDEKVKNYVKAEKDLLKKTVSAVDRAAIRQEIDRFTGDVGRKMHKLELSRTAYERGAWNEGRRYFMQMALLENKATEKWGLSEEDKSLYLQLQRVIETQGKAGSFGMTARNAQIGLDEMKTRLGAAKFAKLEQYSQEFFSIHEREILADARIERALGKSFVDYCRTQTHYVTTKRTFSPEELDAIETARAAVKQAGVAGGDDVITQMYAYAGARGAGSVIGEGAWLGKLKGSMAATQEVRSATWEKADPLMQFGRRNQMVLDLRDALVEAGVEGVRDMVRTDGTEFPSDPRGRYGHINYMENGQKRVLVVPRQISDAFRIDPDNAQWITKANGLVRSMLIDYNVAYFAQNVKRNQDSVEKNMQGMRETWLKTGLRGIAPGVAPIVDLVSQALVRKIPAVGHLFGQHTFFAHVPKAERYAKILENPTAWQQELWKAEAVGNVGKVQQMNEDFAGVMEMLRGNFLVPTSAAYTGAETHGFAFDMMNKKGLKTLAQIEEENRTRSRGRKFVDKINVFKMNQAQQEHEDILAKTVAYLHDRANYAMQRSVAESGLMVKKNVSIAEGERSGRMKRGIQASMAQFFNMVEKGVVRHWKAVKERPGETLVKDGKVWIGRLVGMTFANGVLMKFMLDDDDVKGDEQKALGKYGIVYKYAKAFHTAYQNCSDYVKENYNFTPLWNSADGMTSVIIGGAMTDEDKLIAPSADLVSSWIAHRQGIGPAPEAGKAIANSTFKAVTPDLQLAAPIVNFLRATVEATMIDNPTDYFRNAPMYDEKLWRQRNESWEMRGKFAAQVGCRLWNDFGGRALLAADVNGVDNGRGSAPDTLEDVLRKIPVLSPAIARMIKIQVGSPAKKGAAITERTQRTRDVISLLAQDLLKRGTPDVGWHESHLKEFQEKLADWKETYGLTDADLGELQKKYYNAWIQRKSRSAYDQKALGQLFKEGMKHGLTEEQVWIQLGER